MLRVIIVFVVMAPLVDLMKIPGEFRDEISELNDKALKEKVKNGSIVVGDVIYSPEQHEILFSNKALRRGGLKRAIDRWPGGLIPVEFDYNLPDELRTLVVRSMGYIMARSCVKFDFDFDADEYPHYMFVTTGNGCASELGNQNKGRQLLVVSASCQKGNLVHELLHTLGLIHMHQTQNRNSYVNINYRNIWPRYIKNFDKIVSHVSMFDTPYDLLSIMHYGKKAFAIDQKQNTLTPLENVKPLGQRRRMSEGDVIRLNRMYKCPGYIGIAIGPDLEEIVAEEKFTRKWQEESKQSPEKVDIEDRSQPLEPTSEKVDIKDRSPPSSESTPEKVDTEDTSKPSQQMIDSEPLKEKESEPPVDSQLPSEGGPSQDETEKAQEDSAAVLPNSSQKSNDAQKTKMLVVSTENLALMLQPLSDLQKKLKAILLKVNKL